MKCIINNTLKDGMASGKSLTTIARYLRMKYNISIPVQLLRDRSKTLNYGANSFAA